jgi:hypothetical protein
MNKLVSFLLLGCSSNNRKLQHIMIKIKQKGGVGGGGFSANIIIGTCTEIIAKEKS